MIWCQLKGLTVTTKSTLVCCPNTPKSSNHGLSRNIPKKLILKVIRFFSIISFLTFWTWNHHPYQSSRQYELLPPCGGWFQGQNMNNKYFFFNFSFQLVTLYVTSNMFALTLELFKTLTNFEVWNWRNFIFIKNGFSGPANFHIKFKYLEKHYLIISNSVIRIIFYSVLTNGSDWCVSVEFEYVQFCISSMYNSLLSKLEIWNYRGL